MRSIFSKKGLRLLGLMSVMAAQGYGQSGHMQLFKLNEVRLLQSPFLTAEQTDLSYMLKLEPDRLLAPFLREAGLKPKAESYGNWENSGLDGHTAGHYLTALAQMYAATGNLQCQQRLTYMVSELARCQSQDASGYVGGVPNSRKMWQEVKQGDFSDFNKRWVPWYNLHKLFAGLRDAYELAGNQQAKTVLIKLTDWANQEVAGLSEAQMQQMLNTEHGGMNEVCADVAAITGNPKYLALAKRFSHQAVLQPLRQRRDQLSGMHANTQIPKIIGFERIAELNQDTAYASAARFFWQTVVHNRSVSFGGNSVREHFNPPDNFASMLESPEGPETCNSNNMLKLTKMLFSVEANESYINFYERLLYNHILSSQHPGRGGFVYFTPIHPQHYRVYSTADQSFWCCVGTGMENHGKYGELIYSHQQNKLFVNLFIPSQLNWKANGIQLTQQTRFPESEQTQLTLKLSKPRQFALYIRKPQWVKDGGFRVSINGKALVSAVVEGNYMVVNRLWKTGDRVTVALPMKTYAEYLPDHSEWVSFLHGPVVLAAPTDSANTPGLYANDSRWGHIAGGPMIGLDQAPLLVKDGSDLATSVKSVGNQSEAFTISKLIYQPQFKRLQLKPFYQVHDTRYVLYWPVAAKDSIPARQAELQMLDQRYIKLAARTVDQVVPGEQQPENDHQYAGEQSETGLFRNIHWRSAAGSFSYQMRLSPEAKTLSITYYGREKDCSFDIYLADQKIAHVTLDGNGPDAFVNQEYPIPNELKAGGKKQVQVKFVATKPAKTAAIYDVRFLK